MLLPVMEITDPALTMSAPATPMISAAPSASGVRVAATSGTTPVATSEVSVITTPTVQIVITKANGTSRLGFDDSPAGMPMTSYPPYAKIKSSAAVPNCAIDTCGIAEKCAGLMNHNPTTMNRNSGASLPTVNTLTANDDCLIPRMLIHARMTVTSVMSSGRYQPPASDGQ